ncbi:MAG: AgmX/PglI C-terminal domain-containing protein [Cellvibrionaceae bacterium]
MSSVVMQPVALDLVLPWQPSEDQEQKFQNLLKRALIPLLLLFLIIPFLPIMEKEYEEPETEIVITKVLLKPVVEPQPVPQTPEKIKPPKPVEKEIPKPKEIVKPEPKAANIKTPKKNSKGSAKKTAVKTDKVEQKISVRSSQGLNELSSQLSELRGSLDLTRMKNKNLSDNTVGSAARSSRTVLGSDQVTRKSGGINVDGNLLKNESTTLAAHTTTAVDGLVENGTGPSGNQSYLSTKQGRRDMESIRRTLERTKSNVYSLYQRALLERPDLAGKFVFKILIEPDGSISDLKLLSSELNLKELEKKILSRIKQINFGAEDVSQTPVEYKFVFLPS